jgi:hypothetical protein
MKEGKMVMKGEKMVVKGIFLSSGFKSGAKGN